MKLRYIAHWFLGGSNRDTLRAETLEDLVPFVTSRIPDTRKSAGGITLCVADRQSRAADTWIWSMDSGGEITTAARSAQAKKFAQLIEQHAS